MINSGALGHGSGTGADMLADEAHAADQYLLAMPEPLRFLINSSRLMLSFLSVSSAILCTLKAAHHLMILAHNQPDIVDCLG